MKVSLIIFVNNEKEIENFFINNRNINKKQVDISIIPVKDFTISQNFYDNFNIYRGKTLGNKFYKALVNVKGDIVTYISATSIFFEETLENVCKIFKIHHNITWIIGKKYVCDKDNSNIYNILKIYPHHLIVKGGFGLVADNCILQEGAFFRVSVLDKIDIKDIQQYDYAIDFFLWKALAMSEILYSIDDNYVKTIRHNFEEKIINKRKAEMQRIIGKNELTQREIFLLESIDKLNNLNSEKIVNTFYVLDSLGNRKCTSRIGVGKVSIITVCYNDADIYVTCDSIVNQTMQDFEWIVIDGGSCGNVVNIINQYKNRIDCFISERDDGVYNAMNKGIIRANCEFINFMNSGDLFESCDVLEKVFENTHNEGAILYGKEKRVLPGKSVFIQDFPDKINKLFFFDFFLAHQSMFIKKELFNKYGLYDEKFKISADNEKNLAFITHNEKFQKVNIIIAARVLDGISDNDECKEERLKEKKIRRKKYFSENEILKLSDKYEEENFLPLFSRKSYAQGKIKEYFVLNCLILKTVRYK